MFGSPQRSPFAIERAKKVFKLLDRAHFKVGRTYGHADAMFVAGGLSTLFCLVLQGQKLPDFPSLFPASWLGANSAAIVLGSLLLINAAATLTHLRQIRFPFLRPWIAALPIINLFFLKHHGRSSNGTSGSSLGETVQGRLQLKMRVWRKPFFHSRLLDSRIALMVPIGFVPAGLIFSGMILAQHPEGSVPRDMANGLQVYCYLIGIIAWYQYEIHESRVKLTRRRRWKLWPLAALPWGFGICATMAILQRYSAQDDTLAMPLLYDRRNTRRDHWLTRQDRLPRYRSAKIPKSGIRMDMDSIFRIQCCLVFLQMIVLGVFFRPGLPPTVLIIETFAATLAIVLGCGLKGLNPKKNSLKPRTLSAAWGWTVASLGSACLGWIFGVSIGQRNLACASACLFIFGVFGILFAALMMTLGTRLSSLKGPDFLWLPTVFGCIALGAYGLEQIEVQLAIESWLLRLGMASWLLFLPIGLIHHRTLLEPFTILDLWRNDLPPATRRELLPISLALVLPLGGLANGFMASRSLDRDRVLRLWWESLGGIHDPL